MYPALAIVERLPAASTSVLWIGGEGGVEKTLVERAGLPFAAIPAGGLHGVGLVRSIRNALKLIAGTWQRVALSGKASARGAVDDGRLCQRAGGRGLLAAACADFAVFAGY